MTAGGGQDRDHRGKDGTRTRITVIGTIDGSAVPGEATAIESGTGTEHGIDSSTEFGIHGCMYPLHLCVYTEMPGLRWVSVVRIWLFCAPGPYLTFRKLLARRAAPIHPLRDVMYIPCDPQAILAPTFPGQNIRVRERYQERYRSGSGRMASEVALGQNTQAIVRFTPGNQQARMSFLT